MVKRVLLLLAIICIFIIFPGANTKIIAKQQNIENNDVKRINYNKEAIKMYKKFLSGQITIDGVSINDITIPTGEPDKRYETDYAFFDSNGDYIPELHVKSARYYYIFTFIDNRLSLWKDLSLDRYSYPLTNGGFIKYDDISAFSEEYYEYYILDYSGKKIWSNVFYKQNINYDDTSDENSYEYYYAGVKVTKEQWNKLTNPFLYIDDKGEEQISNQLNWNVLYK